MNYLFLNNFFYRFDEDIHEKEILNFHINNIDHEKYNFIIHNKYTKKYTLILYNFYNIDYDKFEKNNDYSIYLIFYEKTMIYIENNLKKLSYNHIFLNDYNSYSYVSKYVYRKPSNDLLVVYYGSLKNYKNFQMFNERFTKSFDKIFENTNVKKMFFINNDVYKNIPYENENDVSVLVDNLDNVNFIYIIYLICVFYKNIQKINFSKIILVSINHSIIGISSLCNIKFSSNCNYYADSFFNFCIFNEFDFIKISTLFPNFLYSDNSNFLQYVKKYSNINFKKIEDMSIIKIN